MRLLAIFLLLILASCARERQPASIIFGQEEGADGPCDLPQIQRAGTLIVATLNGPDTYYDYHGQPQGTQYLLSRAFASHIGVKLQIALAPDTAALQQMLAQGQADLVALPTTQPWATRPEATQLRQRLNQWWHTQRPAAQQAISRPPAPKRRQAQAAMKDRKGGVVSAYDHLLVQAAQSLGWDWRLLAAMCYQESAFDAQAESWMGARGLMQVMPATARELGIHPDALWNAATNIRAATQYIRRLERTFADVPDADQRRLMVLAAYNGGSLHIRDAMALASAHGADPHRWHQVSQWVLRLAEPQYYRHPAVEHGYMRGSETEAYVRQILDRWAQYRRLARPHSRASTPKPAKRNTRDGRHVSSVRGADAYAADSVGLP